MMIFSAVGCPDLKPGVGHSSGLFWVRYSSDRSSADVGCSRLLDPEVSWKLHCIGQSWIGHMGNCSRIAENVSASSNSDEVQLNAGRWTLLVNNK